MEEEISQLVSENAFALTCIQQTGVDTMEVVTCEGDSFVIRVSNSGFHVIHTDSATQQHIMK